MLSKRLIVFLFLLVAVGTNAQVLKPGFNKEEYIELLKITAYQLDTPWNGHVSLQHPKDFHLEYRSPVVALLNRWDLWMSKNVAVISLRGTVNDNASWLENFFSVMIPATGDLQLSNTDKFHYELSDNPKAAVHTGWMIGMLAMSKTIIPKIDSCYRNGIRDFIIVGHSQGGALAYLLRSYLDYMQRSKKLPDNIHIKTYCSAAPKPGNLYYAFSYENLTRGGWGLTVINSADWVPETPLSLQTVNDFNNTNPFMDAKKTIKKLKFPTNLFLSMGYNKMNNPAQKLKRRYKKYLGDFMYKTAKKTMPELVKPAFYNSSDYVRTGYMIILKADSAYYAKFPDSKTNVFVHHMMKPYMYLAERYYE